MHVPRQSALKSTSGLYLHSPALEGMWMEAYQSTWERCACALQSRAAFPSTSTQFNAKERSHEQFANHHKINYIEFPSTDIERTKQFYATVFGWSFLDYGPDYVELQRGQRRHRRRLYKDRSRTGAGEIRAAGRALLRGSEGDRSRNRGRGRQHRRADVRVSRAGGVFTSPTEWEMCWQSGRSEDS